MSLPPPAVAEHKKAQRKRALQAVLLARSLWASMPEDFDEGWAKIGARLVALVALAQFGAAQDGSSYVATALAQQGRTVKPDALVVPAAFAGKAPGGGTLSNMLYGAVIQSRTVVADSTPQRLLAGRNWLDAAVQTTVSDAGRDASMAAITARPNVRWVRVVDVPCCQRCAVIAGATYRYETQFERHPNCGCTTMPQTEVDPQSTGVVIGPGDVHDLTAKQRQMIDDGRDFNKVINDYQRKRGGFLPPTRVDQLTAKRSRGAAVDSLISAGYLAA